MSHDTPDARSQTGALNAVQRHYTAENLPSRLDAALREAGLGTGPVEWSRLAHVDQFHTRGMEATRELAEALGLEGGETFLDVGCGFGGPARFLAATYDCRVTGIDLTPAYIEVADILARRSGLRERLIFVQGDALALPFPDASYDAAWTVHVGMNIADKARLYAGMARVLRPGGRLAVYDILRGGGEPPAYPVPWARTPETSFLVTEEALTELLRQGGFGEIAVTDRTPQTLQWLATRRAAQGGAGLPASPPASGEVSLVAMILGERAPEISANLARNFEEGRVRVVQVIARRS